MLPTFVLREVVEQKRTAARLAVELAERFHAAGNFNDRELAEFRAEGAEVELEGLEFDAKVLASRTELAGLLGLVFLG